MHANQSYPARVPYSCDSTFVSVRCERSEREISQLIVQSNNQPQIVTLRSCMQGYSRAHPRDTWAMVGSRAHHLLRLIQRASPACSASLRPDM